MAHREIIFNMPYLTGKELEYIAEAHANRRLSGNGIFTRKCQKLLQEILSPRCTALLTQSCTAALEMAAMLLNIAPGDEVIMPSYTFVSTANAFVLRGGVPVFMDVREDTLNMDETLIEAAITKKTKAIAVVHYAGVSCEMDTILAVAEKYGLPVVEDAAQGIMASYKGAWLGNIGALGALSFHETKNVISGEGGSLIVNDPALVARAEIVWEKGTDRTRFARGEVDKYTWRDIGSSYLPSELTAAFLYAQLEVAKELTDRRLVLWSAYHALFRGFKAKYGLQLPSIPDGCTHNGHIYYVIFPSSELCAAFVRYCKANDIGAVTHYVPLHSSPAGRKYGRTNGALPVTDRQASRLVRLPLWQGMSMEDIAYIAEKTDDFLQKTI
jgi:dTDP-4-amino-4,6-dideoxygalactose transaminase